MRRLNEICDKKLYHSSKKEAKLCGSNRANFLCSRKKILTISRIVSHYQYFVRELLKSALEDSNSLVEYNVLSIISSMYIDFLVSLLINMGMRYEANAERWAKISCLFFFFFLINILINY